MVMAIYAAVTFFVVLWNCGRRHSCCAGKRGEKLAMYNIVICDDDETYIHYLKYKILESGISGDTLQFYEYHSGEEMMEHLDISCDLAIVDMQMAVMDGHDTAKIIRERNKAATIVFCSGICQPTTESFRVQPFAYLMKTFSDEKMCAELKVILEEMYSKKTVSMIRGRYHDEWFEVSVNDISHISITKRGCHLWLSDNGNDTSVRNPLFVAEKLNSLYNKLYQYGFAYAHNSYIVNLRYVRSIRQELLILSDGTQLNIARSKSKDFRIKFVKFVSMAGW